MKIKIDCSLVLMRYDGHLSRVCESLAGPCSRKVEPQPAARRQNSLIRSIRNTFKT